MPDLLDGTGDKRKPHIPQGVSHHALETRTMSHTIRDKSKLLNRVRRLGGQVGGLERALKNEEGCLDVLQRIAAVRGAVTSLMAHVLSEHLDEHVVDGRTPAARRRASQELRAFMLTYFK